ncbi:sodium- and chloride-dependent GABA transporter 2-like [Acropora millepora]|uniref:sodium- and chloride-dependent GABA transporter 2-like n=1 Tax=Acropora millepora TaxID=45264 RepID=UPI001CF3581B|nr:sodium- and chloride-dependent GABA transporter 2-like [Acropora millepora]XP_029204696.2 sodium- and chloride-dependent GABA transporter 2-like [Acropora millepora]XP_029204698.2 sodium- and chloride-dependent GABA transporter 2-like [Acropora millepora]
MMAEVKQRETWSSKLDFLLALMGFSIGLGNIWRFPYLCFKNGGGCFLIPYLICLILAGVPVLVLEIAMGQFTSQGAITAWKMCPLFQGIGYAGVAVMQYVNIYYTVILGWSLYYMFASFRSSLPWSHCNNEWNTPNCVDNLQRKNIIEQQVNNTIQNVTLFANGTVSNISASKSGDLVLASEEYWEYRVLRISSGLDQQGAVRWDLALCLLLAWVICYLCVCKGVKSSGKVVYFTATAPYILLTVLLIRGVTLPGAAEGIKFYLTPNWSRLKDGQVWIDAGTQVFFSYSIGTGTMAALGSYNTFHNNFYRDSIIFTLFNSGTSFYGGFLIFSVLGFMAQNQGVPVDKVAKSGPGLAFIVYPEAVSQMPLAPLWSVLFFIMLFLLGLDSEFVGIEGVVTAIVDRFPQYLRRGYRKEMFTALVCVVWFLIGLSMVTEGGMYVFQLFDGYSGSGSVLLLVVICETLAIGWLYGCRRFYSDMERMLGFRINPWIGWCWCFFAPTFCAFIFIFNVATYTPLKYGSYVFPGWGMAIAWLLTMSSLLLIPSVMIYKLMNTNGTILERLNKLIIPQLDDIKDEEMMKLSQLETNCESKGNQA